MTEYSLLESSIKIERYIEYAIKNNLKYISITDRNCLFGVAKFYELTTKNNIKPIVGIDLDVEDFRLIILAKNYDGYLELVKLASLKGENKNIQIKDIDCKNIYIIDHPRFGYYYKYHKTLPFTNYYIGCNNELPNPNAVFINETNALNVDDFIALDLLNKIKDINNPNHAHYFKGAYKLNANFNNSNLLKNSFLIADNCNLLFPDYKDIIPNFKNNINSMSSDDLLRQISYKKLDELELNTPIYVSRLEDELKTIKNMKFSDYFLIVYDFIKWAKSQDISIGPGRGSSAGSLTIFLLNITDIDPIKNNLIFERFLNKDRISLPDIDIDIEDNRRNEVVDYIFNKYGINHVAHIITFQRFGAKGSIRDVGRILNLPIPEIDSISKTINGLELLEYSYINNMKFQNLINKSEIYKKLYSIARLIEGLPKNIGTHAAGIVISNASLIKRVPTILAADKKKQTQYSMNFLEKHGLLKIDLLGLRNLTIIKSILNQVQYNWNKKLLIEQINLNDKETLKILSEADTYGIFQLESFGMRSTLKKIKIDTFDDLVACLSLYRPGPRDYINLYASRKKGEAKIQKINEIVDKILASTYGIMIYQEQILEIVQRFAGIPYSQADILRRAIGKKDQDQITKLRSVFLDGVVAQKHDYKVGERIFDMIEKFGLYGFNKSHACAYALISYRMAFLKARFPFEYYTAIINSSLSSSKVLINYLIEAQSRQIKIKGPHINLSKIDVHSSDNEIFLPLISIMGLGNIVNEKIIGEREKNGLFIDFFDFITRATIIKLGISNIENLILGGALRDFGSSYQLIKSLPIAQRYADMIITSDKLGNKIITNSNLLKPNIAESKDDFFDFQNESKKIGFNLTYNPMLQFNKSRFINNAKDFETIYLFIKDVSFKKTKTNMDMCIVKVYDGFITKDIVVFDRSQIDLLKKNSIISGKMKLNKYYNGKDEYILNNIQVVKTYEEK